MQCPHCSIAFRDIWHWNRMKYDNGFDAGWDCITAVCPECHKPSIKIKASPTTGAPLVDMVSKAFVKEQLVYPTSRRGKRFCHEVPDDFKNDYLEACEVLLVSPRSSATLSRRILEAVLREQGAQTASGTFTNHLSKLKHQPSGMVHQPSSSTDHPGLQTGQRPVLHCLR